MKTHTTRIGEEFSKELEGIKEKRIKSGLDKKRRSTGELTNLLIKHSHWEEIKKDMMEIKLQDNKNGK